MLEPKQIIENIRKTRFDIGLDTTNLTEEQIQALKDNEKILKDASKLAREIHTKNLHSILELIQNAEDNEYINNIAKIKFIIDSDRLIIQNNEKGFEKENVWALCGIGGSTKTKILGYIGEKGIGFKSVFMIADKVQIFSNGFQLRFWHSKENPLWEKWKHATMIIPEWIDEIPDFIDPNQTNIVLYIRPEVKNKISSYIEEIQPSLLLFLRKLKVIEIEDRNQDSLRRIEKIERDGMVEITDNKKKSYWKVIRKALKVNSNIDEERRENVKETEIVLAFPVNENVIPDTSNEQHVFAFLPVREYGFKFIVQADFILPITREDIAKDNRWNEWLRDSILEVFLDAIEKFKSDDKLRYSFYDYLSFEEVKDDFFIPLVEQIYEKLKKKECILTEGNRWRRPSEVLIADNEIRELIPNEDLQELFGKEYLSEKIKTKNFILSKLGIGDFSIDDLIKCLENTEWIKKHNMGWFVRLFSYLSKKKLSDEQLERIKNLSIMKLENGELTSINKGVVFFPLEKKVVYGFEDEFRVIKKDVIEAISEQEKEKRDKILVFLKRLGLKQAHPYEIIENHILPIYESEDWKQKDSKILIGYIRYIKEHIDQYEKESDKKLNANKSSWEPKEDPLKRLRESIFIRINKDNEGKEWYDNPRNIYLPRIYGNGNNLDELFEGIDVNFVHQCYIEQDIKQLNSKISELKNKIKSKKWRKKHRKKVKNIKSQIKHLEEEKNKKIEEWKDFLLRISINKIPKMEYYDGTVSDKDRYPTSEEREYSTRGHNVKDWRLSQEFNELLERNNPDRIKILLTVLNDHWNDTYSKYLKMDYQWFYYYEQHKILSSSFIRDLKESIKVPTTQNTLAKPLEVFLDKPKIREVLGDTVPYLAVEIKNEDFIKSIGINTKANADGVLNYLKAIIEKKSEDKKKFEKLYKFLDEHFEEDSATIKREFSENSLIFVPDSEQKYHNSKELIWKDVSNVFGRNRIYLEKYYPTLRDFFVKKLGISEKPIPKDYADVLVTISEKDKISKEDKKIIVKIYEELNRNLNPDKVEIPISHEDWWKDFIKKPIFPTNKFNFWSNNGNIFINDNNELYELFKGEEYIGFIWLPKSYNSDKIKYLITACGLRHLSENVEKKPLIEETTEYSKDEKLTNLIQNTIPYVLRYLYWKDSEAYEELKKEEIKLQKICAIEVYLTDNLRVKYSLKVNDWKTVKKEAEEKCIYHDGRLFEKKDASIYDLAVEFSKVFGEIKGLDDFVMNIMNNISHAEDIMKAKNIGVLPPEEKEILRTLFEIKTKETRKIEDQTKKREEDIFKEKKEDTLIFQEVKDGKAILTHAEFPKEVSDGSRYASDIAKREKDWSPEFSPEEVPVNVKEYNKSEENKTKPKDREFSTYEPHRIPTPSEVPSQKAKENIGRWGEEYVYICIKNELKEKYPDTYLVKTEQGFRLEKDGNLIVQVVWLNKEKESGEHYDVKIVENGEEIFVEVKSTKEHEKAWFRVSKDQWRLLREKGNKFYIYRVYGAGTKEVKAEKIPNPAKLWLEGRIDANPIGIEL